MPLCKCGCGELCNKTYVKGHNNRGKRKNYEGKRFGKLLVIERGKNKYKYLCRCICGKFTEVSSSDLVTGNTKSCGCLQRERTSKSHLIDLSNKRFGRLKVLFRKGSDSQGFAKWECICDCGNIVTVAGINLRKGDTKSCGCYQRYITGKSNRKNLQGRKFGKLIVVEEKGRHSGNGQVIWKCKCSCGRFSFPTCTSLLLGSSKSCGYCNGTVSKSGTLFLDCIEKLLDIKICREYKLKKFRYDGRINNLFIEVDGSYWHRNTEEKDARKDKLAKEKGFDIIRCKVDSINEAFEKALFYKKRISNYLIKV